MKTILLNTLILLILGCSENIGIIEKEVVCVIDGTDTSIHKPSFEEIKPFLNLADNDYGLVFKTKMIGDIDFGSSFEKSLTPKDYNTDETIEDRFIRKKKFLKDVETGYIKISSKATPKNHSIIYRVIATELNKLSDSKAKHRILLVNSDLMENSKELNFYKPKDYNLLMNSPCSVEGKLINELQLNDLKGITVYFLFQPKDFYQNDTYKSILDIYIKIITKAGGVCMIGNES